MERTNEQRQESAYRAVLYYQQHESHDDIEAAIIDLTTDLLHLADQYGIGMDDLQRISRHHYNAEKVEA